MKSEEYKIRFTNFEGGKNMYVYDKANELARSLRESKEYLEYKKAKEEVKAVPELKEKID